MRYTPLISITNNSTVLPDSVVQSAIPSLQYQISYHFRPFWDSTATLYFAGKTPLAKTWELAILDNSDQAGALGYHDFDPAALPTAKVFAATDEKYALSWSVTTSHELLEMLADPYISLAAQVSNTEFYGYEVCDPCEGDQYGYTHNGVLLSDFCLPAWWVPGSPKQLDYKSHIKTPLGLLPDGYASIFVSGKGWKMVQMQKGELVDVTKDEAAEPRFRDRSKVA